MTVTTTPGAKIVPLGIGIFANSTTPAQVSLSPMDAAASGGDAVIMYGQIFLESGAGTSKTLDTSGSSAIVFRAGSVTWANGGSTLRVGLAAMDTGNGPPARAVNSTGAITFDVYRNITGGSGLTASAWNSIVPTSGTKTVNHGDIVGLCFQLTARGGSDSVVVAATSTDATNVFPSVTTYIDGAYGVPSTALPNAVIIFSDGTRGYFFGSDLASGSQTRTFNSASSPNEYGELYQFPFPVDVYGFYAWVQASSNFTVNLYTGTMGSTPASQRSLAVDANITSSAGAVRRIRGLFTTPYSVAADTPFSLVFTPGAGTAILVPYRTLNNANDRIVDIDGTSMHGVSRSGGSGAFANTNSSLDHYYIGPLVGGFDDGAGGGGASRRFVRGMRGGMQ